MSLSLFLAALAYSGLTTAQRPGTAPETHPQLTTWKCTNSGGCKAQNNFVVLDALSHPVYQANATGYSCNVGAGLNRTACPDAKTCQQNCVMDGVSDYASHGVKVDGGNLHLDMLAQDGTAYSPRLYLLAEDEQTYEMFKLTGQEFSFDVDMSKLPCGMNGALYMSEMPADGGKSALNTGGAHYGTGYCDAQCYATSFINGEVLPFMAAT